MITTEGWLDWAERIPGPTDKKYTQGNLAGRYIPHSAVGYYNGWASRLFSTDRNPDGTYTDYAAASVHLWIPYNVRPGKPAIIQHYPFTVSCWASGNREANCNGIAAENEGGYDPVDEPLTLFQRLMNVFIIQELAAWKGWVPYRPNGLANATLLEHNECVRLWGGGATSCPDNRIPWAEILQNLSQNQEEPMIRHWVTELNPPPGRLFRTYTAHDDYGQATKALVVDGRTHESLAATGLTLEHWPLDRIKKLISRPGTPEPDA